LTESKFIYSDLTEKIIGAALKVHKILGPGFLESVYEEAFALELELRNIPFESQKSIEVEYKGRCVKEFICDFFVYDKIIVELKAINKITDIEKSQIINYLKATGSKLGLIFNFGS
jgi:GxxExxY protein